MYQLLITLRDDVAQAVGETFRSQMLKWDGVSNATKLEFDPDMPEIPPYFFVYIGTEAALDEVIGRLKGISLVESVEVPPVRYCAHNDRAVPEKKTANPARRVF